VSRKSSRAFARAPLLVPPPALLPYPPLPPFLADLPLSFDLLFATSQTSNEVSTSP